MDVPPPQRGATPTPPSAPEVPAYPAPLPDPVSSGSAHNTSENPDHEMNEDESREEETKVEEIKASLDSSSAQAPSSNGVSDMELEKSSVTLPPTHSEDPLESPIAQPEELRLPNGVPLLAPQNPLGKALNAAECDDSPIAEPDQSQQSDSPTCAAVAAVTQTVSATPTAVSQLASAPAIEEAPTEVTEPPQPEVRDTVTKVVPEVREDAPQLQTDAKEDLPSPTETVSSADNTSETESAHPPPPPTAEKKEEAPSPPTVTPVPVETAMQGQSLFLKFWLFWPSFEQSPSLFNMSVSSEI